MLWKCLDLFCGKGGWSEGFTKESFEVFGVDIIDVGYPSFNILLEDVRNLDGKDFQDYDVIVGSPPCRNFTQVIACWGKNWKKPPNISEGLELVNAFLRIVKEANPKFWVMENVPNLRKYIDLKPKAMINLKHRGMKRALWGNFPDCIFPYQKAKVREVNVGGKLRSWIRAKIPLCISQTLARAIRHELEGFM